ncbi:MAG: nucleotidyltransferase family protein, partial [Oscillospiraceae bacterium]|nr:nucleotidyltransferase family protein [Oscillospiraceae bacterium]
RLEAAALGILTRLGPEGIAAAPEAGEGLSNRIAAAAAAAETLDELLARAKCRRYTMARIRRCVWQAVLGITAEDQAAPPPVLRVLAAGPRGRELLAGMKRTAALPVVTKPAAVNRLDGAARRAAALEARADSLRSLGLAAREELFRQTPFIFGSDRG